MAERRSEDRIRVSVSVAPNGGRLTRADHAAVPTTAAELARCAAECLEAGAAMIHVHVRDRDGRHLLDAEAYRDATAAIRAEVGDRLIVQITSEALGRYAPAEQRAVVLAAAPEAVSLALRELAPDQSEEAAFADLMETLCRRGCAPQIILYSPEEAVRLADLIRRGLAPQHVCVLYALGRYSDGQRAAPSDLLAFLASGMPRFSHWTVCAFGPREVACVATAALLGGHARVGFENNRTLPDGRPASCNADLVSAAVDALTSLGFEIADADALRAMTSSGSI
jgi:3-keto-5-aminohexanoate cleavage enzyme